MPGGGGQPLHWRRPQRAKRAGSGGGGGAGRPAKPGAPLTAKALKTFSCVTGARAAGTGAPAGAAPRGQAAGRGGCRRRGLPQQRTKRAPPRTPPSSPDAAAADWRRPVARGAGRRAASRAPRPAPRCPRGAGSPGPASPPPDARGTHPGRRSAILFAEVTSPQRGSGGGGVTSARGGRGWGG